MAYGYWGKILEINLDDQTFREKSYPEEDYKSFFGGSGLASKILYDEYDHLAAPLSAENPMIFMAGLLTGTTVPTACKASVVTKSPLTGIWAEATVGGFWGKELKKTGYDGFVIKGCSAEKTMITIEDDQVRFCNADDLWGLDTYETEKRIRQEQGEKFEVACIGPAGENLVSIAGIAIGGEKTRMAGRCGVGAVMGFKNLKAIAVTGTRKIPIFNKEKLAALLKEHIPEIRKNAKGLTDFGSAGGVQGVEANGDLPIRNWTLGSWEEGAAKICGQAMVQEIFKGHYACSACPIRCGKEVDIRVGPHQGTVANSPQYETCAAFGSNILNDDMDYLCAANDLCNRFGLDTICAGNAVAMAMECFENGLISRDDAGGLDLRWGNGEAVLGLIEMIAYRRDIGAVFAQGVEKAAELIGGLAKEYAIHTKGLSYALHDPRAFTSMAVIYATGNRGACHLEGLTFFVESGVMPSAALGLHHQYDRHGHLHKAELALTMQNYMETLNALGLCKFLVRGKVGPGIVGEWLNAVTGWDLDAGDFNQVGERLYNQKRLYNCRLGISRKDDVLPPRLMVHDRKTGAAAGSLPHLGKMLSDYYELRGWSPEGIPEKETIEALGLWRCAAERGTI